MCCRFLLQGSFTTPFTKLVPRIIHQGLVVGGISGSVFMALNLFFYRLYGQQFLHEAFLHHLTRKDPRHNFSMYFYHIYLTFLEPFQGAPFADPSKLAFLPQLVLVIVFAWCFHKHLPFAWLLQTMAFVSFNKVRGSQAFGRPKSSWTSPQRGTFPGRISCPKHTCSLHLADLNIICRFKALRTVLRFWVSYVIAIYSDQQISAS